MRVILLKYNEEMTLNEFLRCYNCGKRFKIIKKNKFSSEYKPSCKCIDGDMVISVG